MNKKKTIVSMILLVLLTLVVTAFTSGASAASVDLPGEAANAPTIQQDGRYASLYTRGDQLSGGDVHVSAVGIAAGKHISSENFSGDDAYDPASGLHLAELQAYIPDAARSGSGFSGDDAYDPAMGGLGK